LRLAGNLVSLLGIYGRPLRFSRLNRIFYIISVWDNMDLTGELEFNNNSCRLKNILLTKPKKSLYRAFTLPYFNSVLQPSLSPLRKRNTAKIEKVNERALRYVFKNESSSYQDLLQRIRLRTSMETRRIQDMLLTINNGISDKAPFAIRDLIILRSSKDNLQHYYILSSPKINTTKYGLKSWRYFAAKK